jgi:hypothetical protein
MMAETYEHFMVFILEDTGERAKLDITEEQFRMNNGKNILNSTQVYVIVKEDFRRIYIWNGAFSSVRKKFIASRVASDLQNELLTAAHFHHCKIVSVDQGDEPEDFLNAFGFKPFEINESEHASIPTQNSFKEEQKIIHKWNGPPPKLKETKIESEQSREDQIEYNKYSDRNANTIEKESEVIERIISTKVPEHFKRQNLILGNFNIYSAVTKKINIFGKQVEEVEWETVNSAPKEVFQIDNLSLRLHFNNEKGKFEGIEILEPLSVVKEKPKKVVIDYNRWTVKQLKEYCKKHEIKVPSSYRKAQIIELVIEYNQNN